MIKKIQHLFTLLPDWIRWTLIIPSLPISWYLGWFIFYNLNKWSIRLYLDDGWYSKYLLNFTSHGFATTISMIITCEMIPRYKTTAAISLCSFFSVFFGINLYIKFLSFTTQSWFSIISSGGSCVFFSIITACSLTKYYNNHDDEIF